MHGTAWGDRGTWAVVPTGLRLCDPLGDDVDAIEEGAQCGDDGCSGRRPPGNPTPAGDLRVNQSMWDHGRG